MGSDELWNKWHLSVKLLIYIYLIDYLKKRQGRGLAKYGDSSSRFHNVPCFPLLLCIFREHSGPSIVDMGW